MAPATAITRGSVQLISALQLIGLKQDLVPERARQLLQRARQQLTDVNQQQRLVGFPATTFACVSQGIAYKFPDLTPEEIQLMLGLDELKQTRFYQEAQREGIEQGLEQGSRRKEAELLSRTVPVLLRAGLSIDQIAQQLQVEPEAVRRAADSTQN